MATQGNLIPLYQEFLADTETPVSAYLKIKDRSFSYLLESDATVKELQQPLPRTPNKDRFAVSKLEPNFRKEDFEPAVRKAKDHIVAAEMLKPSALVISPGPGNPGEAGVSVEMIRHFGTRIPVLGVCL